jgi:hypothetical protein
MHQEKRTLGTGRTQEFRNNAVRIALTSGLSRKRIAVDPGGGMSMRNRRITPHRDVNGFYNPRLGHSALAGKGPFAVARQVAQTSRWRSTNTPEDAAVSVHHRILQV